MSYSRYDNEDWSFAEVLFVIVVLFLIGLGIYGLAGCACKPAQAEAKHNEAISACKAKGSYNAHYCELRMECIQFQKEDICDSKLQKLYMEEMQKQIVDVQKLVQEKKHGKEGELVLYRNEYNKQNGKYCHIWDEDEENKCIDIRSMPTIESIESDIDSEIRQLEMNVPLYQSAIDDCVENHKCNRYLE